VVKEMGLAMDACKQYSIADYGASADVYGILSKANMLATSFSTAMPSPTIQHMWPLE